MAHFFVDAPFSDAWSTVRYLQQAREGTLDIRSLFNQHNESRIFFPRLLMIGMALITAWNSAYEIAAVAIIATATSSLLCIQALRNTPDILGRTRYWLPFFFSLLVFSPLQYECWNFGFTIVGHMNVLFVTAGLFCLAKTPLSIGALAGALAAGTIATYSYANGLIFWPTGLLLILMRARDDHREHPSAGSFSRHARICIFWIFFAALAALLYFHGYVMPGPPHPPTLFFISYPGIFVKYTLSLIGASIVNIPNLLPVTASITAGAFGLLVFFAGAAAWIFSTGGRFSSFPFWIALGCYSIMTALMVSLGRCGYSVLHSLESRYTLFSYLFWIATLTMAACMVQQGNAILARRHRKSARFLLNCSAIAVSATCLLLFLLSSFSAIGRWRERHAFMAEIRHELLTDRPDQEILGRSFPAVSYMLELAAWLREQRLSLFRDEPPLETLQLVEAKSGQAPVIECDFPPNRSLDTDSFLLSGTLQGILPSRQVKAIVLADGNGAIVARTGSPRGRAAEWRLGFKARKLPLGVSDLNIFALLRREKKAVRIARVELAVTASSEMNAVFRPESFVEDPEDTWGYLDTVHHAGDFLYVVGWARDPASNKPCDWVGVADSHTNFLAFVRVREKRTDVVDAFDDRNLLFSGWRVALPGGLFESGRHILKAYVMLEEEHKAVRLNNEFELIVP